MMTIRELIKALEAQAAVHGEDTPVVVFDEYTAAEGWDYEEDDLWQSASTRYHTDRKVVEIYGVDFEDEEDYQSSFLLSDML